MAPMPAAGSDPRVDEILAIVARETKIERERLQLNARIDDLGIGSLDLTLVMFELESHFRIEFPLEPETARDASLTVGMLIDQVITILDQRANPPAGA